MFKCVAWIGMVCRQAGKWCVQTNVRPSIRVSVSVKMNSYQVILCREREEGSKSLLRQTFQVSQTLKKLRLPSSLHGHSGLQVILPVPDLLDVLGSFPEDGDLWCSLVLLQLGNLSAEDLEARLEVIATFPLQHVV